MSVAALLHERAEVAGIVWEMAQQQPEFAPNYYEYPESLAALLKASARLELALKRRQQEQADGIALRVNLNHIHQIKFDQWEALGIFIDFMWEEDVEAFGEVFFTHLPEALAAGALMTSLELGQVIDYSPADLPAQKFLELHVPKLAKETTEITKERVKNTIRRGLLEGKDREAISNDLRSVFDNPSRRRMIVQTESVQAFSEGRIQAGIEMGASGKEWQAQVVRCPLCGDLHGKQVPIDEEFPGGVFAPPRHPRCRCGQRLVFGKRLATPEIIADRRKSYIESLSVRFT